MLCVLQCVYHTSFSSEYPTKDIADHSTGVSIQHPGILQKGFKEEVSLKE